MLSVISQRGRNFQQKNKKTIQIELKDKLSNSEEYESIIIERDISEMKEQSPQNNQQNLLSLCFYSKYKHKMDQTVSKNTSKIFKMSQDLTKQNFSMQIPLTSSNDIKETSQLKLKDHKSYIQIKENVNFLQGSSSTKDLKRYEPFKTQQQQKIQVKDHYRKNVPSPIPSVKQVTQQNFQQFSQRKRIVDDQINNYKGKLLFIDQKILANTKSTKDKLPLTLYHQIQQNQVQIRRMLSPNNKIL